MKSKNLVLSLGIVSMLLYLIEVSDPFIGRSFTSIVFIIPTLFTLTCSVLYFRGKKMHDSARILGILCIVSGFISYSVLSIAIGILMIKGSVKNGSVKKKKEIDAIKRNRNTVLTLGIVGLGLGLTIGGACLIDAIGIIGNNTLFNVMNSENGIPGVPEVSLLVNLVVLPIQLLVLFFTLSLFLPAIPIFVLSLCYYKGKNMYTKAIVLGILSILISIVTFSIIALVMGINMISGANMKKKELLENKVEELSTRA